MPRVTDQTTANLRSQEYRLQEASAALREEKFSTLMAAAKHFHVPKSTLADRMNGIQSRVSVRENSHLMTKDEEGLLRKWIRAVETQGTAPSIKTVQSLANIVLARRESEPCESVNRSWASRFLKREQETRNGYSRASGKKSKVQDHAVFHEWCALVKSTIQKFNIEEDDIYSVVEMRHAMQRTDTVNVTTKSKISAQRNFMSTQNSEWVTSLECLDASGQLLPSHFILRENTANHRQFMQENTYNIQWDSSVSGWLDEKTAVNWLRNTFLPSTTAKAKGSYSLLILDLRANLVSSEFGTLCKNHKIVPLRIPPHSSHILQPFDVGCFSLFKYHYEEAIAEFAQSISSKIDVEDFLQSHHIASLGTFQEETIKDAFKAAGLSPVDADKVISRLGPQFPESPSTTVPCSDSDSDYLTDLDELNFGSLADYETLKSLASHIKTLQEKYQISSQNPDKQLMDYVSDYFQRLMPQIAFLKSENDDLRRELKKRRLEKDQ